MAGIDAILEGKGKPRDALLALAGWAFGLLAFLALWAAVFRPPFFFPPEPVDLAALPGVGAAIGDLGPPIPVPAGGFEVRFPAGWTVKRHVSGKHLAAAPDDDPTKGAIVAGFDDGASPWRVDPRFTTFVRPALEREFSPARVDTVRPVQKGWIAGLEVTLDHGGLRMAQIELHDRTRRYLVALSCPRDDFESRRPAFLAVAASLRALDDN